MQILQVTVAFSSFLVHYFHTPDPVVLVHCNDLQALQWVDGVNIWCSAT